MLVDIRIKLRTPMMGKNLDAEGVHRFARADGGLVSLEPKTWHWMLTQASRDLGLTVDCGTVRAPLGVRPGTTVLKRRKWNVTKVAMFEAIPKGAELGFRVAIVDEKGAPTPEQLKAMLEYVGEYIGISQWGAQPPYAYGRFKVLKTQEAVYGAGGDTLERRGSDDSPSLSQAGG